MSGPACKARCSVALFLEFVDGQAALDVEFAEQFFDVLGEDVTFDVDAGAGTIAGQRGIAVRVRDDGDAERIAFERSDGEADAVDGDGAFVDRSEEHTSELQSPMYL